MKLSDLEIEILAHRYLYYVKAAPVISDYEYDKLESRAKRLLPPESAVHLPGSDLASSYPHEAVAHAFHLESLRS